MIFVEYFVVFRTAVGNKRSAAIGVRIATAVTITGKYAYDGTSSDGPPALRGPVPSLRLRWVYKKCIIATFFFKSYEPSTFVCFSSLSRRQQQLSFCPAVSVTWGFLRISTGSITIKLFSAPRLKPSKNAIVDFSKRVKIMIRIAQNAVVFHTLLLFWWLIGLTGAADYRKDPVNSEPEEKNVSKIWLLRYACLTV